MSKNIFMIGATSRFAQEILPLLREKHTIVTAGRKDCDVYCDVTKSFTIPADIDVVINFAAVFGGKNDSEILQAVEVNVEGALNVCMAAKAASIKHVISISSIFALLDEMAPQYSIYSITKRQADELMDFYCGLNEIDLTVLRPSRLYGDSDKLRDNQPFFYDLIDKAQRGEDITLYGSHDARRNYMHVVDLAAILNKVMEQHITGIYSCAHPQDVTYSEVAEHAQTIFGAGGTTGFLDDKPDTSDDMLVRDTSLYEAIGYMPAISVDAGIERIKRYREGGVA